MAFELKIIDKLDYVLVSRVALVFVVQLFVVKTSVTQAPQKNEDALRVPDVRSELLRGPG
jgi:hypothetical protein